MNDLISGAMVMAYSVAAMYFLRFWRRSRDPLFGHFSLAFWILAAQRLALSISGEDYEHRTFFYIARLLAFVVIIWAIVQKNRAPRQDTRA